MKNIYLTLLIFSISISSIAQTTYWTSYNFSVASENEGTVYKIMDEHFKNNPVEGVTVYLYENHISDSGNNYTHNVILSGSKEAMAANYDSPKNKAFELFQSKIGYFIEPHSSSMGNRTSAFNNGNKPIQKYYFIDADNSSKLSAAFVNYGKYRPKNHQALFGSITSGVSPAGESNWIIIGFDSFKDALEQSDYRINNKNAQQAWDKYLDDGFSGETKIVRSGLRIMLGKW
tara:strand:+ start:42 stop:734 length:693 start_codon:yes stop_codon:yes gene_type:complete